MKKIAVITGSRAEYGLLRSIMNCINTNNNLNLYVIVVGMHFAKEFGNTVEEIKKDGFNIDAMIDTLGKEDTAAGMSRFIGRTIIEITSTFERIKPDLVLVLGDRAESLAATVAASYMNILIAHVHGGDVSAAGLDEHARHAITKFAHIHFPATKKSAQRIIKMGEDIKDIYMVGAPGLDAILNEEIKTKDEIEKKYCMNFSEPVLMVVQHPVTTEIAKACMQIKQTMEAVKELAYKTIVVYPNADAGGRKMIKIIEQYRKYPFVQIYKNLPREDYISLMKYVSVLVGNSSSGIIEAPSFRLPVVNIGTRQFGRERASNVIDADYEKKQIKEAIKKAVSSKKFKNQLKRCHNPYGDGHAGERIVKVLNKIRLDKKLLQKQMTY